MSNKYMMHITKTEIDQPLELSDVVKLVKRHEMSNGKTFASVDESLRNIAPIVKFYGLSLMSYDRGVGYEFVRCGAFGAGALVLVAIGKNRYLYIVQIEDSRQSVARVLAGKA
jgi:hypothetical protein